MADAELFCLSGERTDKGGGQWDPVVDEAKGSSSYRGSVGAIGAGYSAGAGLSFRIG